MTSLNLEQAVTRDAIEKDAHFVGQYISSIASGFAPHRVAPIVNLALFSYFSSFIWESQKKWNFARQGPAAQLPSAVRAIVKNSRNSLKLFEDTERRIEGQLKYFKNHIIGPQRIHFLGRGPIRRPGATDLGVFRYAGHVYCTTHSAAFGMGIPASKLFADGYIKQLTTDYGRYFGLWGAQIREARSFVSYLDDGQAGAIDDTLSSDRYMRTFNEGGPEELNGFLLTLQSMMNFTSKLLPIEPLDETFQTLFKIRFLTLYHVSRSVQAMFGLRDPGISLSPESRTVMKGIVSEPTVKMMITDENMAGLRRSLMHYRPDDRFAPALSQTEPLYGMLSTAFPSCTYDKAIRSVHRASDHVSDLLNEWATLGTK